MEVPHVAGMGAKPPEELRRCGGKEQQRNGVRNFRKEISNGRELVVTCRRANKPSSDAAKKWR